MKKKEAMKKALESAFWLKFPQLDDNQEYTFETLFGEELNTLINNQTSGYLDILLNMMDSGELPLIPVIPVKNGEASDAVALDFH